MAKPKTMKCPACNGKGETRLGNLGHIPMDMDCPECDHTGRLTATQARAYLASLTRQREESRRKITAFDRNIAELEGFLGVHRSGKLRIAKSG